MQDRTYSGTTTSRPSELHGNRDLNQPLKQRRGCRNERMRHAAGPGVIRRKSFIPISIAIRISAKCKMKKNDLPPRIRSSRECVGRSRSCIVLRRTNCHSPTAAPWHPTKARLLPQQSEGAFWTRRNRRAGPLAPNACPVVALESFPSHERRLFSVEPGLRRFVYELFVKNSASLWPGSFWRAGCLG